MSKAATQPFSAVIVSVKDIQDEHLSMQIDLEMSEYERAKIAATEARNVVAEAAAHLLIAQSNRVTTRVALLRSFARGSEKVAAEAGWEPFRNAEGRPAVENFMSERDQRNFNRLQRAEVNEKATAAKANFAGYFENGEDA